METKKDHDRLEMSYFVVIRSIYQLNVYNFDFKVIKSHVFDIEGSLFIFELKQKSRHLKVITIIYYSGM